MNEFAEHIYSELLPAIRVESVAPYEPVVVSGVPKDWQIVGQGNYAAVLAHSAFPDRVVKLYAPGREGLKDEVEVYRRLGKHKAYSECYYADADKGFLVLRRLYGNTLYDCLVQGIRIPEQVVQDIDVALEYARSRGLKPHDVHGKNVMMTRDGRGMVVDVSDFLEDGPSYMWRDLKRAYYRIYLRYMYDRPKGIPEPLMNAVRRGYRIYRKGRSLWGSE